MIFKDRTDAANKLFLKLKNEPLLKERKNVVIVSLLRGGVVLGNVLAKKLGTPHLPLICVKISAPSQEEFAIGALTFDVVYLEKSTVQSLNLTKKEIVKQISLAKEKFIEYCNRFSIDEKLYDQLSGKTVVIVDDGIATGATIKTAALFTKGRGAEKIIVASPVAFDRLNLPGVDRVVVHHKDSHFSAVSQFYAEFPQITENEVQRILKR